MKRLLWTALVTLVSAASAGASVWVLERAWRRIARETPPQIPGWARLLVRPLDRLGQPHTS